MALRARNAYNLRSCRRPCSLDSGLLLPRAQCLDFFPVSSRLQSSWVFSELPVLQCKIKTKPRDVLHVFGRGSKLRVFTCSGSQGSKPRASSSLKVFGAPRVQRLDFLCVFGIPWAHNFAFLGFFGAPGIQTSSVHVVSEFPGLNKSVE